MAPGFDEAEVLSLAASVEARSEHPVARAIEAAAKARGLSLREASRFEALAGYGVTAAVSGKTVAIGAQRYMERLGIGVLGLADAGARLAALARSPLYVAVDGQLAAVLAVADPIKPTAKAAVAALHALGIEVAMISGDSNPVARAVGKALGIDHVTGEVLPEGKVAAVKALQEGGRKVAFVGDGINDAPALAAADVGLAVGGGTDVAVETADVVLMSGDPALVSAAIGLSRATMRNIAQNLFWAFAYNVLLIPVAAGVLWPLNGTLLSPELGAGAMALSSVFVLANALRLKRWTPLRSSAA